MKDIEKSKMIYDNIEIPKELNLVVQRLLQKLRKKDRNRQ